MRISDWSSDVCSSDLCAIWRLGWKKGCGHRAHSIASTTRRSCCRTTPNGVAASSRSSRCKPTAACVPTRSEEHTSELQSLMRISYAVFCLKKKKHNTYTPTTPHHKHYHVLYPSPCRPPITPTHTTHQPWS